MTSKSYLVNQESIFNFQDLVTVVKGSTGVWMPDDGFALRVFLEHNTEKNG